MRLRSLLEIGCVAAALLRVIGGLGGLGVAGGSSGMSSIGNGSWYAASSCGFSVAAVAVSLDDAGVGRCGLAGVGGGLGELLQEFELVLEALMVVLQVGLGLSLSE